MDTLVVHTYAYFMLTVLTFVQMMKKSPNEYHEDQEDCELDDDIEKQVHDVESTLNAKDDDVKETNIDGVIVTDDDLDNSGVKTRLKDHTSRKHTKRRRKQVRLLCWVTNSIV